GAASGPAETGRRHRSEAVQIECGVRAGFRRPRAGGRNAVLAIGCAVLRAASRIAACALAGKQQRLGRLLEFGPASHDPLDLIAVDSAASVQPANRPGRSSRPAVLENSRSPSLVLDAPNPSMRACELSLHARVLGRLVAEVEQSAVSGLDVAETQLAIG